MQIQGHVHNGVVVLASGASLPEGTVVIVSCPEPVSGQVGVQQGPVVFPLVRSKAPGSVNLAPERVAELLDEEDVSS